MRPVPHAGSDDRRTDHGCGAPSPVSRPARRRALIGLVLAGAVLSGCGGGGGGATVQGNGAGAAAGPPTVEAVAAGVCDALAAAEAGDLATARQTFDHGPLHELADTTIEVDRAVTARLLEAKEAVESDLADEGSVARGVAEDLRSLAVVTREAFSASGMPSPPLCEGESP